MVRTCPIGYRGHPASHRPEALAVLLLVIALVLTAILDLPPAGWLVDVNEYFKMAFWGKAVTSGPGR